MSHYTTCSVGVTIFNRGDWAENVDPVFMEMRHQELLDRVSTPQQHWRCQDVGIGFDCDLDNVCRRCDCCGAWICYSHCKISTTYNGERARLCSRCKDMLIMPENEMIAAVNGYKNERVSLTRPSSRSSHAPSTLSAKRGMTPGAANPEYHAPPRRLFSNRRRSKTRVPNVDFPRRLRTASTSSDESAPSSSSEISQPTSDDEPRPGESQGTGAANDAGVDSEDGLTTAAMQENWTFDECRLRPGLFRYLEITRHVRFGDEETSMVSAKVIKPYDREKDTSLPWVTVHDVEASERRRSALCAEITARGTANGPPGDWSANASPDEDATDDAPATAGRGLLLASLPRLSRRSTMFGMAAVAVGLVAWGVSRRR